MTLKITFFNLSHHLVVHHPYTRSYNWMKSPFSTGSRRQTNKQTNKPAGGVAWALFHIPRSRWGVVRLHLLNKFVFNKDFDGNQEEGGGWSPRGPCLACWCSGSPPCLWNAHPQPTFMTMMMMLIMMMMVRMMILIKTSSHPSSPLSSSSSYFVALPPSNVQPIFLHGSRQFPRMKYQHQYF